MCVTSQMFHCLSTCAQRNNTPFQDENPLGTAVTIKGTPIASSPLFGNAVPGSPPTTTGTPVISTATATSNKVLTPSALINNGQVAPQSKNLIQSTINNSDPSSPPGPRWAIAAKKVDLTGRWQIINSDEFREEYDLYLQSLGQPAIVRAIATTIVGFTREETIQDDSGRKFTIKGINPRGVWERTLLSSGTEVGQSMYEAVNATVVTADDEKVQAEAWWEDVGHVHKSWMHGIEKYGGGSFESARYLESRNVLVCKSYFHPNDKSRKTSTMTWRFQREGTK